MLKFWVTNRGIGFAKAISVKYKLMKYKLICQNRDTDVGFKNRINQKISGTKLRGNIKVKKRKN